jgi:phospholipid/cholesterol/gamma-HCH transport system permease protein
LADDAAPLVAVGDEAGVRVFAARGRWVMARAEPLSRAASAAAEAAAGARGVRVDAAGIEAMDTVGALALARLLGRLSARLGGAPGAPPGPGAGEAPGPGAGEAAGPDPRVELAGLDPARRALLDAVLAAEAAPAPPPAREHPILAMVERLGRGAVAALAEARDLVAFVGMVAVAAARTALRPRRLRWTSVVHHVEKVGFDALPIVGLLSFLIGVVLAYQGADQLRRFGAQVFVVNLLGISILREIGVLMTSIIVAGRSGSAFTAQIGTMQVNQEVDAMRTLGLDPIEVLVLPRVAALVVALPLLAFYASVMGLLGGALSALVTLDISLGQFLRQLQTAVPLGTLVAGLVKAPVFAAVIALVGCYEGLKVSGGADSVGRLTTQSVVVSIFLVIVIDAMFSVLFASFGL